MIHVLHQWHVTNDTWTHCTADTELFYAITYFWVHRLVLPKPNTVYIVKNSANGAIFNPSYEARINMPGARGRYILWNCLLFYKETKYITIKITKSFWVPKLTRNVYKDKIAYWVLREVCWGKLAQISSSSVHTDHKYLIILILFKLRYWSLRAYSWSDTFQLLYNEEVLFANVKLGLSIIFMEKNLSMCLMLKKLFKFRLFDHLLMECFLEYGLILELRPGYIPRHILRSNVYGNKNDGR